MTRLFVTGTDTEVGKTFIACALLFALRQRTEHGHDAAPGAGAGIAVGYKPVAAGAESIGGRWINEDALRLQMASTPGFALQEINPVSLRQPIAPHIAAAEEGVALTVKALLPGYRRLAERAEHVIVEGAGGFRVPLNDSEDMADLAVALGLPVLLVVGMRLGCINHALLTAEAVVARGLRLVGWVANSPGPAMPYLDDNVRGLRARLPAPCLGVVAHRADGDACAAAGALDVNTLVRG